MISESLENYLRAIYEIRLEKQTVRVKDITESLKVRNSSVVSAMRKLVKNGLIKYIKYGHIELTQDGLVLASLIYEKHQTIKDFLEKVLNFSDKESEELACGIEHHLNSKLFSRIEALSDFFTSNEELQKKLNGYMKSKKYEESKSLDNFKPGEELVVSRVAGKLIIKKRLLNMGILPGTKIYIERFAPFGDPIEIKLRGFRLSLRKDEAKSIFVEKA
ncbi:MAG: DtxR family transcriptional regulator, Mn-dependent transcriptional regulator [Kosmotogales bacterium]|nr:DtxR family transcriptional regulator, Mn-dependent transcriptional regulator [Kosmotogales bacterium]